MKESTERTTRVVRGQVQLSSGAEVALSQEIISAVLSQHESGESDDGQPVKLLNRELVDSDGAVSYHEGSTGPRIMVFTDAPGGTTNVVVFG